MQPEDIVGLGQHTRLDQPSAQLEQHPPQPGPGQTDVGQRVLPKPAPPPGRGGAAGEDGSADGIQPCGRPSGVASSRRSASPCCRIRRVGPEAAQVEAQRLHQGRRVRQPAPRWRSRGCRRRARSGPGARGTGAATRPRPGRRRRSARSRTSAADRAEQRLGEPRLSPGSRRPGRRATSRPGSARCRSPAGRCSAAGSPGAADEPVVESQ